MLAICLGYDTTGYSSRMDNHRNDTLRKNTMNFYPLQGGEICKIQQSIASARKHELGSHKLQYPSKQPLRV